MQYKIIKKLCLFVVFIITTLNSLAQKTDGKVKMNWFNDAKLGIFIHWGIYSVDGISESWSFFNNYINYDNYMRQLGGFTADRYQPEEWVDLIKSSGAKYTVITTRHHDGVSLWPSKSDHAITVAGQAAAKKDVLTPFVKAVKKANLRLGLYYSLPDWSHPDYDVFTRNKKRYDVASNLPKWKTYQHYLNTQLEELSSQYQPDLYWFDGDWEHSAEEWNSAGILKNIQRHNPDIIVNSRLSHYGDYDTPEQGVPIYRPDADSWELCYTMNDSWGYQPYDTNYKSSNMIIQTLVDCIAMGGNLLLDIGPKADGTIAKEQVQILKDLGRWTAKHQEAIYGTRAGIPENNYSGKSAISKDGKTLYLYLKEQKSIAQLFGIASKLQNVHVVGGQSVAVKFLQRQETISLSLPQTDWDEDVTVLALNFDEQIRFNEPQKTLVTWEKASLEKSTEKAILDFCAFHSQQSPDWLNLGMTEDGLNMKLPLSKNTNSALIKWIGNHAEAFYQTIPGIPADYFSGYSALSKDKQTLYLFVEGKPTGPVALKGIKNGIARVRIVGEGTILPAKVFNKLYWSPTPGIIYIDIPEDRLDQHMTVIAVLLDSPVDLFKEQVKKIDNNL